MDDIRVVQIVDSLNNLINNIFFVFFLENVALSDKSVKINIHMFKDKIDIFIVVGFDDFLEGDDIGMFELL